MSPPSRIPRLLALAALVAAALAPARAGADSGAPALTATFANGAGGWTSTSSCAPLCSVTNTVDPGAGAGEPGSATIVYTTLAGLLGGLASGASTWTSPSFGWTGAAPTRASVTFARKAAIGGLLSVGGSASLRVQLDDVTAGTLTTLADGGIPTADAGFAPQSVTIDPGLLEAAHSYRLRMTTSLSAAALLSGIRVSYDDIVVSGTADTGSAGGPGSAGGSGSTGSTGGTSGNDPGSSSPATGAAGAVRLTASAGVRFTRGEPLTLHVRATRAGKAAGRLVITLRIAGTTRRITTARDGTAAIKLLLRGRGPARITLRAGTAVATTWARPR